MDKSNLLVTTTILFLFVSLFLVFFLVTVKTKHKLSNILFASFLLLNIVDGSEPFFNLMVNGPSNLGMLRNSFAFLQIPVFYLYVLSVCFSDFKLKFKHFLHLLPFLISNIILIPRFYSVSIASKINFILNRPNMIELQFNHILFHIQVFMYIGAVFIFLKKVKKLYLENYAGTSIKSYQWLFQFTSVLTILYFIVLFKNIFKFADYQNISEWIKITVLLFQLLLICWYLLKALNNPHLFRNIDSKLKLVTDIILEEKNNQRLALDENGYNDELLKLKRHMIIEKPFLNSSITIHDISTAIEVAVRDLSLLINHKLEQHFYDFINSYRIEYAMVVLKDSSKSRLTISEILYEAGYNSKSSFNSAFKKHTGSTPTQYRKNL
jgi:AraC-like DNA-binding protein